MAGSIMRKLTTIYFTSKKVTADRLWPREKGGSGFSAQQEAAAGSRPISTGSSILYVAQRRRQQVITQ